MSENSSHSQTLPSYRTSQAGIGLVPRNRDWLGAKTPDCPHLLRELMRIALEPHRPLGVRSQLTLDRSSTRACHTPKATPSSQPPTRPPPEDLHLIHHVWPFSELSGGMLMTLARRIRWETFAAGDSLLRQGQQGRGLILIQGGSVHVVLSETDRECQVVGHVGPGELVGEMSQLTRGPCTADVVASEPVRTATLSSEGVKWLLLNHPTFGAMLSHLMAERLNAPHDVLLGKSLYGYRILRRIGRGGMATVYEAQVPGERRSVALKMMSHRYAYDWEMPRRFQREAAVYESLRHPHIVRMHEHFAAFSTRFIVMEFCDGPSLSDFLKRSGPLSQSAVRRILGQLASALVHAQTLGVVHRDLKPANVLLTRQGVVKLGDFGLARSAQISGLTTHGDLAGTPKYMAPEQLSGDPVDGRADVYALGLMAYEMLHGRPAFNGQDVFRLLQSRAQWVLPRAEAVRPGLATDLYRVLKESLAPDPADRVLQLSRIASWAAPLDLHEIHRRGVVMTGTPNGRPTKDRHV